MTLREYGNKLFKDSFYLRDKQYYCEYKTNQKIKERSKEYYKKSQFIKKLLIAKEDIK